MKRRIGRFKWRLIMLPNRVPTRVEIDTGRVLTADQKQEIEETMMKSRMVGKSKKHAAKDGYKAGLRLAL